VTKPAVIAKRAERVRALVFDWDGVFHDGRKGSGGAGNFLEADSMGVNMLRYGLWRRDGGLPVAAIISGRDDPAAAEFAEREHLHAVYAGMEDKSVALRHLGAAHGFSPDETAVVFDDINDLGMARAASLRFLVRRAADPLFRRYVVKAGLCDYVTGQEAGRCAVREVAELLLGLMEAFEAVVRSRVDYDASYRDYLAQRQACATAGYVWDAGRIAQE
jgi:3-deoxy-D-manno-octulosonate 8-phosphate phosphatase (KDO 8-P phosphatase)